MTSARGLAEWAAGVAVPSGDGAGEPWAVLPWQRRLFGAVVRPGVQTVACSMARANGKTAVAALIARAYLEGGPLWAPGREVLVVSASHQQARLVVGDIETWREDGWLIANSPQMARVRAGGAEVRCVAARPQSLHGQRPDLVIADELAQWQQPERMWAALRTSLGKRAGSRLLALGTRPVSGSGHVFDRLLQGGADVVMAYAATAADERAGRLGWRRTWRKANPSLDVLPSLEGAIRREWEAARDDPQALAAFKSLRLNLGVPDTHENVLLDPGLWERCEPDVLPARAGPMVLGLDLGGGAAFTGAAAYWPTTRRLEAAATCGGVPDLAARGRVDQVGGLYGRMQAAGDLMVQAGRRVPDYGAFLDWLLTRWGAPAVIVADRWRAGELRDGLDASGMPRGRPLVVRAQGWRDGGEDVRRFRRAVAEGRVAAPRSVLIRAALSEARVVADTAGNQKLAKNAAGGRRMRARDDVAAAMILAVAEADRRGAALSAPQVRLVAV